MKKRWIVFTVLLIVALTAFLYIRFFFVFGEGVKSGELNYVVYKRARLQKPTKAS